MQKIFLIDKTTKYYNDFETDVIKASYNNIELYDYLVKFFNALYYNLNFEILNNNIITTDISIRYNLNLYHAILNSKSIITLSTSGTTGIPKKICHSIKTLTKFVKINEKHKDDIWGLAYNPFHISGIQVILQAILNKNTIVNIFNCDNKIEAIERNNITNISATPTYYKLLFKNNYIFNNIKNITVGGERLDEQLLVKLNKYFPNAKIRNIYASTEYGSILQSNNNQFKVAELKDNLKIENNKIFVLINNDWYCTEDIIEWIDTDTFIIAGRDIDEINIGGYKVNIHTVENALLELDNIKNARVYSKKNSVTGNILCADIETNNILDIPKIKKELSNTLKYYQIPSIYKKVNELELTDTFKIKRG